MEVRDDVEEVGDFSPSPCPDLDPDPFGLNNRNDSMNCWIWRLRRRWAGLEHVGNVGIEWFGNGGVGGFIPFPSACACAKAFAFDWARAWACVWYWADGPGPSPRLHSWPCWW
jgi:hypothetical protein